MPEAEEKRDEEGGTSSSGPTSSASADNSAEGEPNNNNKSTKPKKKVTIVEDHIIKDDDNNNNDAKDVVVTGQAAKVKINLRTNRVRELDDLRGNSSQDEASDSATKKPPIFKVGMMIRQEDVIHSLYHFYLNLI